MSFRPQFAYLTPEGYQDERAQFPFDQRQCPGLLGPGGVFYNQVLRLDDDAPFHWRGISWEDPDPYFFLAGAIAIRLRDPFGNFMSDSFVPILDYAQGYYIMQPWTAAPPVGPSYVAPFAGGMGVPFADEIICPASSVIQIDILCLNGSVCATPVGRFMARGVKRRPVGDCPTEFR
jgi:hypothetical protein